MMVHRGEIADADTHAIAGLHHHRRGAGIDAGIEREDVEFGHLIRIGAHGARDDLPLAEHVRRNRDRAALPSVRVDG